MGVVVWVEKEERLAHLYLDNKQVGKGFQEQMELKDLGVWMAASKSLFKTLTTLSTSINKIRNCYK